MNIHLYYTVVVMVTILYASEFEWLLHKEVMHKKFVIFGYTFEYPFRAHALTHHHDFDGRDKYELESHFNWKKFWKIPMAWWNGIVLTAIAGIPSYILSWYTNDWNISKVSVSTIFGYYVTYESIHLCMHLPRPMKALLERVFILGAIIKWVDNHHRIHHQRMGSNLNVVLPFGDLINGTLTRT